MPAPSKTAHSINENPQTKKLAPGELTHIATRGAFWNIGLAFANKGFTLVGQVVLAWLLTPKDMGLAGMATATAGIVAFMNASGVTDVLIQRGKYKEEAGQGLWLSLLLSFSTSVLIACLGPIASWMGRPELSKMLFILAFLPIADALSPILSASLKSDLNFKYFALSNFFAGITYTFCAVLLAYFGFGAYSLILPVIPRALVNWASMIPKAKFPGFEKPQFHLIKKLIRPSLSISLTGFLNALQQQAPIFCVGLVTDFTVTGHFSWGWQVASQAVFLLAVNLRQVLMPTLAKISNDPERQAVATLRATRAITALLITTCGVQALLGQPILNHLFPDKWYAAGPVITWISLGLVFQGVYVCFSAWLNAAGRYRDLLVVTTLPVLLGAGLAYWGAEIKGAEGAALGSSLGLCLSAIASFSFMPKKILFAQSRVFGIPFLISGISWLIFFYLNSWATSLVTSSILSILFLSLSSFSWWRWGGEQFRDILKRLLEKYFLSSRATNPKSEKASKVPIPNFFIIGAPKCGTTALSEYLRGHPKIFISSPKEPEFFSSDLAKQLKMSLKTYLSLFSKVNPKTHKAIGEASTAYLFSKVAVKEILRFNPRAKFIVMLRNPIDLVQAFHAQMIYQGVENIFNFETAWRAEKERIKGKRIPFFCFDPNSLMYSEWGKLGRQIERLLENVDKEKIKFILFDDFKNNTKKVYEEVLMFLSVDSDNRIKFPKVNESKKVILPFLQPVLALPLKLAKLFRAILGFPKDLEIFIKLLSINGKLNTRTPISSDFKIELINYFKEDINKLSKLLKIDLTNWLV